MTSEPVNDLLDDEPDADLIAEAANTVQDHNPLRLQMEGS